MSPSASILPSYSPSLSEKTRLELPADTPIYYPSVDPAGRPHFVPTSHTDSAPRVGRRGSKQREWRCAPLGAIEEDDEHERAIEV